ncbi:MAG: HEPN domain-containing protein [Bacteroidota bacterium]
MSGEINKVILKAEDFLEDADYLFEGKRFEAVVNRCYYAMFTIVQGLLLSNNIFSKTHQGTMIKFHELFIKTELLPVELGKNQGISWLLAWTGATWLSV